MADDDPWLLKEDGYLNVDTECKNIVYHPNLNVLLITTGNGQVYVFDVNFGVILQRSCLSGKPDGKLQGIYLAEGVDKVLYTDGHGIGVRSDYNGVLLLDTILQTPVSRSEDIIKLELLLSEALLLDQCLRSIDLPGVDQVQDVLHELWNKIHAAQSIHKKGIKAQKWNTICLELPHGVLKLVCSGLVTELKRQNKHIPALPIASAINERLNGLLPSLISDGGPADKVLMFSEAARHKTFSKWPHMNYKWALPGQMAQAGFYHEPNTTAEDRAMCFTCNVCLVCWEPTDEPWSEHERHSPSCPFLKGEYTQNVPLSVTLATAPACKTTDNIEIIGTTNYPGLTGTASNNGLINIWDITNQLKNEISFYIVMCNQNNNDDDNDEDEDDDNSTTNNINNNKNNKKIQFYASKNLSTSYLSRISPNKTTLTTNDYKNNHNNINLTTLSIVGGPKIKIDDIKNNINNCGSTTSLVTQIESTDTSVRPCLICGLTINYNNSTTTSSTTSSSTSSSATTTSTTSTAATTTSTTTTNNNIRKLDNVWSSTTDLAQSSTSSSSLVRAMNNVNNATSDSLDIMKVAIDENKNNNNINNNIISHYLIIYDIHHNKIIKKTNKDDKLKNIKSKKTLSGTGTSASSTGGRQESLYQELYMNKLLYEAPVIEDVDAEMVVGTHFDNMLTGSGLASSSNSLYSTSFVGMNVVLPQSSTNPYDTLFNPINYEQYPSTSELTSTTINNNNHNINNNNNNNDKKIIDVIKDDPIVLQTICIEGHSSLKITHTETTKDGKHFYVVLSSPINTSTTTSTTTTTTTVTEATEEIAASTATVANDAASSSSPSSSSSIINTNKMDIDDENSESYLQKSYMYWYQDDGSSVDNKIINNEDNNDDDNNNNNKNSLLLIYKFDFTDKVPKLIADPIVKRELTYNQTPVQSILLPLQDKNNINDCILNDEPKGQVAIVCRDGIVRIIELKTLKIINEAHGSTDDEKFISAAYCNRLERLCACTINGGLRFFATNEEDDSTEENDDNEDINMMITDSILSNENIAPSTSTSSVSYQEPIIALRQTLTYNDLKCLYDLTKFDKHSPIYNATVPPCWSEMMQGQRQRRYPQHLHQTEDQHHTRTWRLQNDATTWDEHIFELTLPKNIAGSIGHVDVRFTLHTPCTESPSIQVTLLKQNITGLGHHKSTLTPVDERIQFNINNEQQQHQQHQHHQQHQQQQQQHVKNDNPVISEGYQRQNNTEILCGPINLKRCMDLSDNSGCVTLTSPKLFKAKAATLLVHIKALIDPTKDVNTKTRINLLETKPPTSKKLRIDDSGPYIPGAAIERLAASANKKLDYYIGCDWIHEISITVRSVQSTTIQNEKIQRLTMLDSLLFTDNLLNIACFETSDKTLVVQSLSLDILIWITSIRLARLRIGQNNNDVITLQLDTIKCIQERLKNLLRTCILNGGRSIAHKCVKLILICSEGIRNLDDNNYHTFDENVLSVIVTLLPQIIGIQWAGSLRWLSVLITRLLPLDKNHNVAQQCIIILQQIANEMSNRVNPYHLLLATRFGLYNNSFDTELFDIEPPIPPKSTSSPLTYASVVTGEQTTVSSVTGNCLYTQDHIDLRDLLTLPNNPNSELVLPSKLKTLCSTFPMKGLLEVEPLHFTCHAASDGTKMEKIDSGLNTINLGTIYDSTVTINNTGADLKNVQPNYTMDAGSLGPDLHSTYKQNLKILQSHLNSQLSKNSTTSQLSSLTPDDLSDSDDINNIVNDNTIWLGGDKNYTTNSHVFTINNTKDKSTASTNHTSTSTKIDDCHNNKKKEEVVFPWGRLLSTPSQQALVVERMHSGARRFVTLDFGSPILLTDLIIPSCSDLVSLSIDIWTRSEESDGTRLVVAGDIGTKPLVVNDLQPPPVCRYLKITTIGRYGMTTTRCKIPLGMFYGHMFVLPGEDYSETTTNDAINSDDGQYDANMLSIIESQCNILSALAEDVQCRFSLATERLKSLLDPLLCTETPNVMHMQYYLCRGKNINDNNNSSNNNNKEQPSNKILSTYHECIMFQHQLNIVRGVWRRLESWKSPQLISSTQLTSVSSDKLRVLGETLSDILLYTMYEIGPVPPVPMSLCDIFTPTICEQFFHSVCVVTPAPRLQLHAAVLLARVAGHQPWWGNFLANTIVNLYSTSSTYIFPQDRVFILLTFLGRKSLIAGNNKSSVIDAMVKTLERLLSPLLTIQQNTNSSQLDITLIGWILLFLSICLDTTATNLTCSDDNNDNKNKDTNISSRWEFLQGESAMQRKYVTANRTSASRSYRKKLQKRLMHHKQQLHDIEQGKKSGLNSPQIIATWSSTVPQNPTIFSTKLEVLKTHERNFKKTLKQHSAFKHFKDTVSRRPETQYLTRSNRNQLLTNTSTSSTSTSTSTSSSSRIDTSDNDNDYMTNLSQQYVLPVARGLVTLILKNSANVDMFLLACKVVARLVVSTRPIITLGELMSEEQLFKLIKLATGSTDAAWSSHAISCLLQDLLEGGRLFSKSSLSTASGTASGTATGTSTSTTLIQNTNDGLFENLELEETQIISDSDLNLIAGTSNNTSGSVGVSVSANNNNNNGNPSNVVTSGINDEGFAEGEGDEDTQDSITIQQPTASTSKSNGFDLPSLLESDDSELDEFLDDILESGKNMLKAGKLLQKIPSSSSSGISLALDARLEYGVEMGVEIAVRRYSTLGAYNLPLSINTTIQMPSTSTSSSARNSTWTDMRINNDQLPSSVAMLTRCFDKIFTDLTLQNSGTSLELVLQLWLTLNLDSSIEQCTSTTNSSSNQFDPSLIPIIPLSSTAISGLISALLWNPGVSLRAWCLALQTLTVASNEPMPNNHIDPSINTPLDGLLGGMASCIVKDRNMGSMLLKLLSGNGLNVESSDKQYMMAGPRVGLALQDFLVRLEMRCDVITPGSILGNSLKELLLWVVYQLVQPGGALVARRGPLDAQCILITSLINLNFINTDLGTAMSITECVGSIVSNYIRGARVGAQCTGAVDNNTNQTSGFGSLYASVLGGGGCSSNNNNCNNNNSNIINSTRQGRPTSWDTLVVALIKLVCRLVQTPLPNLRTSRIIDNTIDMETNDSSLRLNNTITTPIASTSTSTSSSTINITSQTDESKVAEQQNTTMIGGNINRGTIIKPKYPCVADTVLQHEPTMMRLLGALGYSNGSSFAMFFNDEMIGGIGGGGGSSTTCTSELNEPASISDATFQLLTTLMKKATNPTLIINPLYRYLSSSNEQTGTNRHMGVMQLSESLLWYILKVLDNEASLSVFTTMGGVKVLCENMVKSSTSCNNNNGVSTPGVIALVMQHLSNSSNLTTASAISTSNKKTTTASTSTTINNDTYDDGLLNFAPLGTISWVKPMVEPADVLIHSVPQHRRARTAAWSYHFFPGEAWVDLTITLPCAILLKEVELQPHLSSLATCPSAVALEISREGSSDLTPICPPMLTAGLTFIRLTLAQPEVATSVLVRLYKPRDSTNISLSQIRILGTTAFGDIKLRNEPMDEEQFSKTSLGWLRLVHQCLCVSELSKTLTQNVLNSASSVDGLIEACCSMLLLPAPSLFTPNLERVLLQLGLHSRDLGLQLISLLLNNRCAPLIQGLSSFQKNSTVQLVVELLQQLCSSQDSNTEARISAVLTWLHASAMNSVARSNRINPNIVSPPAIYIHCVSTIIWKSHEQQQNRQYNLELLLTDDLFNSLYKWTLKLDTYSALKLSIDATLCAFCYVRPSLFLQLLQYVKLHNIITTNIINNNNNNNNTTTASISDDEKHSEGQTDDGKIIIHEAMDNNKLLELTEGQLLTVAAASRSSTGIQQLIDSGLPTILINGINDFCKNEKARQQNDNTDNDDLRQNLKTNCGLTDSDKAGETTATSASSAAASSSSSANDNNGYLNMNDPDSIATVLEFLTLICSEGKMRDWLGKEGRIFWFPLASLLSYRPVENPSITFARINASYARLESAMIKFLSRCCWCHPINQNLLSELLTNVILQQRVTQNVRYLHGISGFTRRLILQLLLEGEKILVSVTSEAPMPVSSTTATQTIPSMPPHPAHPLGHYHQLLYISTQSTVADLLQQVSGTWLSSMLLNAYKENDTNTSGLNHSRELWESGMALVVDALSVAAGNTAKDKRAKEASNRSQARGPILRKSRLVSDGIASSSKSGMSSQGSSMNLLSQQYLTHSSRPNSSLPPQLTISQLLAIGEDNGLSLSEPCLHLVLRQRNKDNNKDDNNKNDDNDIVLNNRQIESALGVFSAGGGLAVLAKHLPLVYPDTGRSTTSFIEKSPSPEQNDAEWVKVEATEDIYEDLEESGIINSPKTTATTTTTTTTPPIPHVPLHSLAAFGLFLRLPGYAEVLLKDRKQAQCLLRLALGVTDDGEGGDILGSSLATTLPTLPFQVLKQLLETTPPTTDDGQLLRKTMIEIGAVLLLLNCLAIFTHQTGHNDNIDYRNIGQSTSSGNGGGGGTSGTSGNIGGRSDDKSHLYWAKGTGFGTGSTQQSWNVEQALLRQKSEEEHVTVLLKVIASYIDFGGQPQRDLPITFSELMSRSCLLPALSSYLRNDSVLDMARHIPLYRAILQLIRSMALSPQLAPLLLPKNKKLNDPSIVSLLLNMKLCVDTYVHKINRTRGSKSKILTKYPDDNEQDEGLATLIPDIQESATIVQNATSRLIIHDEDLAGPSPIIQDIPLKTIEQRYLEVMKNLQFDTYEMIMENSDGSGYKFCVSYHFESNMRAAGDRSHPTRVKRLAQETVSLSTALPLSYSSSVFVRCDADRLDIMKVLITGPAETPYANGCFQFDVYFPPDYPNSPMLINLETTGRHTVRFNPNLYNDGKVCLSVLNTWHGRPEEKWNAHTSSFLQVLVSIQSLILVPEPYFNEPGYERSRGTSSGVQSSQEYNANVCLATVKWAMLDQILNPCPCFKEVIYTHFWIKRHEIVQQLENWISEMESHGSDRRSTRSNSSVNALALRRHYKSLRDALNKLETPEGLEDLAEPLQSPGSPLELTASAATPNSTISLTSSTINPTPTTSTTSTTPNSTTITSINNPSASNHVHHDIDTDVEMEKMVSKVCE